MTACPVDGRDVTAPAIICQTCAGVLERALGDVDWLVDELDTTLTRQTKTRPARGSQAQDGPPMPYNIRASETARDLRNLLKDWAALVAEGVADEGRFIALPTPATAKTLSAWLMHHIQWLTRHDTAPDAYSEIVGAVNNIRRVIDIAPDQTYIGPCYADIEGVECTDDVYATQDSPTARCRTCGTTHDTAARTSQAAAIATTSTATAITISRSLTLGGLPLEPTRIRKWAQRGHLTPAGTNHRGHPTYTIAHIARLIHLHETGQKLSHHTTEQEPA